MGPGDSPSCSKALGIVVRVSIVMLTDRSTTGPSENLMCFCLLPSIPYLAAVFYSFSSSAVGSNGVSDIYIYTERDAECLY